MQRRPAAIVERDYKQIKKYIDTHTDILSLKEISEALNLSESMVKTSLSHHPRVYQKLMNTIKFNKEKALMASAEKVEETHELKPTYVIDASITGFIEVLTFVNYILKENSITLTNVTIRELEKLQRYPDVPGNNARRILAMAAGNTKFECVKINENHETADMSIVCYCAENKDKTILVTADKTMELYARSLDVKTKFLSNAPKEVSPVIEKKHEEHKKAVSNSYRINTLYPASFKSGTLSISRLNTRYTSIRIFSGRFSKSTNELKIGDDVYIASDKGSYFTFSHFKIVSISPENNCTLIYSKRIYNPMDINRLTDPSYKSFMKEFIERSVI